MNTHLVDAATLDPQAVSGSELEQALPFFPPATPVILVTHLGDVVGTWAMPRYRHVECLWIHPAYRSGAAVGRRLLAAMRREARQADDRVVLTAALSDDVIDMCYAFGGKELPGRHFVLPIGG